MIKKLMLLLYALYKHGPAMGQVSNLFSLAHAKLPSVVVSVHAFNQQPPASLNTLFHTVLCSSRIIDESRVFPGSGRGGGN
jgi:hypothetical protein